MILLKIIGEMKVHVLLIGLSIFSLHSFGQNFTLKQCIEYASKNNGNIINANYDVDIAQEKVNEQMGTILPQIDASVSYLNNLKLNTTVLPGEIIGQPGTSVAIQMGTRHNASGGVQVSQKIFDPTFGVALKAVRLSKEQTEHSLKLTTEKIQYNISLLYYQTLVIEKQINSLQSTSNSSNVLLESTELRFKNGMAKKIDVDKIRVSHNNTQSLLVQSELSYKQSINNLKYYMGMPVDSTIILSETIRDSDIKLLFEIEDSFSYENRTDYQLQKINLDAFVLDKKRNKAGYLPSLSMNVYGGYNALRNEFDFLNGGDWYPNSYVGLSLKVPIFDGLQRHARISQSKLNIEKSKINIQQFQESVKVDISNSEIEYRNAIDNIQNDKSTLDLAESILRSTQLQYQQGTCSALDLVQSETSYRESLYSYYSKLLNFYIARINLENSKGRLTEYINSLK